MVRSLLGVLAGGLARAWLSTHRMQVDTHPALSEAHGRPWVLAFFHGTQWPLLAWPRRRKTIVLVSLSADGAIQASALASLGFAVVRGSSSRGGVRGLAALVRTARAQHLDAAFAVDGPKGPYGTVSKGALFAAKHLGGVLVPMGSAVAPGRATTFARAWDRFVLAWPFSRVAVVLGAPLDPAIAGAAELGEAIEQANARARAILAATGAPMLVSGGFRADSGAHVAGDARESN